MAGKLAQVGLQIGGEDRRVFCRFPSPCRPGLCRLPQIGPANFTYRFTFPDRLVLHDAKPRALLGE
jgi:hypothetical protein